MKRNIILSVIVVSSLVLGCSPKISESRWIYVQGEHIGDVIDFKGGYYEVQNRNRIIRVDSNQYVGNIVNYNSRRMTIRSSSGSIGIYKYW